MIFLIFLIAQNIDGGYTLEQPEPEAILKSTYDLCFLAKIRELFAPSNTFFIFFFST